MQENYGATRSCCKTRFEGNPLLKWQKSEMLALQASQIFCTLEFKLQFNATSDILDAVATISEFTADINWADGSQTLEIQCVASA